MRTSLAIKLFGSSVAVGAISLPSATMAACNTVNGVVTCTEASTVDDANAAISRTPPPAVTVVVAPNAVVQGSFNSQIRVDNSRFRGAIGYTNDGTVGATDRPNDFVAFGDSSNTANTFNLINRGVQNGGISALAMGGAITGTNSGTVTRGITLTGSGPISFTNTGTVFLSNNPGGAGAIRLESSRSVATTLADGTQRSTVSGGLVTAAIGGRVVSPAIGTTPARPSGVVARGTGGADVTITGQAGVLSVEAGGETNNQFFSFTNAAGGTSINNSSRRTSSAEARVVVGETGSVTSIFLTSFGSATAAINGVVQGGFNSVRVSATGEETSRSTRTFGNFLTTSGQSFANSATSVGGAASIDIGATGRVLGDMFAASNAGPVTVRVAGIVGGATSPGSISATAVGSNGSSQGSSANRPDGSFESSNASRQGPAGGAALVVIGMTGNVASNVSASGTFPRWWRMPPG